MIRRRVKDSPFTQIDNRALRRRDMTWEAKGLLTYLVGLPTDWSVHMSQLEEEFPAGRDKLRRIFKELMDLGYVVRESVRDESGRIVSWDHIVDDVPMTENAENAVQDSNSTRRRETRQVDSQKTGNPPGGFTPPINKELTNSEKEAKASLLGRKLTPLFKATSSSESSGGNGLAAPQKRMITATPRKANSWVTFIQRATEAWNQHKHQRWVTAGTLTGREMKDLGEFWTHFGKDLEPASTAFANAVRWASKNESWADGKVLTLAELLANSKMIQYAQKASQIVSERRKSAEAEAGGVRVLPGQVMAYQGSYNVKVVTVEGSVITVTKLGTGEQFSAYPDELGAPL